MINDNDDDDNNNDTYVYSMVNIAIHLYRSSIRTFARLLDAMAF